MSAVDTIFGDFGSRTKSGLLSRISFVRLMKLGGAVGVLSIGAYAIFINRFAIVSDNAVVTAYSLSLRSPIEGVVDAPKLRIGETIQRGAMMAEIHNPLLDDQRLADLRGQLSREKAHLEAIEAERSTLTALSADLESRFQAYVSASMTRLDLTLAESQAALRSLADRRGQSARALARREALARKGYASVADLDRARMEASAAAQEEAAQVKRIEKTHAQIAALKTGVFMEAGGIDVAYSRQRSDEIAIRLSEISRQQAFASGNIADIAGRIASEEERLAKLRTATMTAPVAGVVWKVHASAGERARAGEPIAQVVDCNASFIMAAVPQNRISDIVIGAQAHYRLSGETIEREGRVLSVTGERTAGDHNFAALPFEDTASNAMARIELAHDEPQCFVGRTVRVVLPSRKQLTVAQFLSRIF